MKVLIGPPEVQARFASGTVLPVQDYRKTKTCSEIFVLMPIRGFGSRSQEGGGATPNGSARPEDEHGFEREDVLTVNRP
jgi:hypothetical protein